jgi:hypothetical protein
VDPAVPVVLPVSAGKQPTYAAANISPKETRRTRFI